jgi:hypothetical protein
MAEYVKSKHFSWGWCVGGAVLLFVISFLGGIGILAAGVTNPWIQLAVTGFCYLLTGFVIGWKSEGQTIVEAGIASVLALAIALAIRGGGILFFMTPVGAIVTVVPALVAMLGAFIGEKVQGDVVRTSDD